MMNIFQDMTGQRFGRLIVVKRIPNLPNSKVTRWECKCDCGNITFTGRPNLMHGKSTSCGCYAAESKRKRKTRTTHNESRTRLYSIWQSMKQRCYDKNTNGYEQYGAKGIKICEEWMDYNNFSKWSTENGYSELLTIDRKENSKGYNPENCRWLTMKEQNRNKIKNRIIELDGDKKCVSYWSETLNIPINTIVNRLNRGCSPEEALNQNYHKRTEK